MHCNERLLHSDPNARGRASKLETPSQLQMDCLSPENMLLSHHMTDIASARIIPHTAPQSLMKSDFITNEENGKDANIGVRTFISAAACVGGRCGMGDADARTTYKPPTQPTHSLWPHWSSQWPHNPLTGLTRHVHAFHNLETSNAESQSGFWTDLTTNILKPIHTDLIS